MKTVVEPVSQIAEEVVLEEFIDPSTITTPIPVVTKPRKKAAKRVPKTGTKTSQELYDAAVKSLSDDEKLKLINILKDEVNSLSQLCDNLKQNCDSAYEKVRLVTKQYEDLKIEAQAKLQYVKQAISFCNTSVILNGQLKQD